MIQRIAASIERKGATIENTSCWYPPRPSPACSWFDWDKIRAMDPTIYKASKLEVAIVINVSVASCRDPKLAAPGFKTYHRCCSISDCSGTPRVYRRTELQRGS